MGCRPPNTTPVYTSQFSYTLSENLTSIVNLSSLVNVSFAFSSLQSSSIFVDSFAYTFYANAFCTAVNYIIVPNITTVIYYIRSGPLTY